MVETLQFHLHKMQQYYIQKKLDKDIEITGDLYHYLKNVVKVKKKEKFYLFNGQEKAIYHVHNIDTFDKVIYVKQECVIKVEGPHYKVDLVVGLLKKDNIELIIQKATELGVNDIYLTKLQNNVVKFESKKVDKKLMRYNEIALSATCQSKRSTLTTVYYKEKKEYIDFPQYDYIFFLYEQEGDNTLYSKLREIENLNNKKILVICGPEGGYSEEEVDFFKKKSQSVSINKNILRAETAAITAIGLIKGIKG